MTPSAQRNGWLWWALTYLQITTHKEYPRVEFTRTLVVIRRLKTGHLVGNTRWKNPLFGTVGKGWGQVVAV